MMTRDYHQATAYRRLDMSGSRLDWANQPHPFKTYPNAAPFDLPWPPDFPAAPLSRVTGSGTLTRRPDAARLAALLHMSGGLTARSVHGDVYFRAAASAGALYPTEAYLVLGSETGIEPGVYHWPVTRMALERLRSGDHRARLDPAETRPAYLILTAVYWRSAWKYRARAWRYCLLDTGHFLAGVLWGATGLGLMAWARFGFDDRSVADLLGLHLDQECPLVVVGLGRPGAEPPPPPPLDQDPPEAEALSRREVCFQDILEARRASERRQARAALPSRRKPVGLKVSPSRIEADLTVTIGRRRSRRNFLKQPITLTQLAGLLGVICPGFPGDVYGSGDGACSLARMFLVAGQVEGLAPGVHEFFPDSMTLTHLGEADVRPRLASAALGQAWMASAAVSLILAAPLDELTRKRGERGYREVMLEAGLLGQRIYLAATALGWGCCGVGAFYDDEVRSLLDSDRLDPLYMLCFGPIKGGLR
jgi:SagB-type dehydrogenase family enzyme